MEGGHGDPRRPPPQRDGQPGPHLLGRAPGEGQRQARLRPDLAGWPPRRRSGWSASGSCPSRAGDDHQRRGGGGGRPLLRVEAVERRASRPRPPGPFVHNVPPPRLTRPGPARPAPARPGSGRAPRPAVRRRPGRPCAPAVSVPCRGGIRRFGRARGRYRDGYLEQGPAGGELARPEQPDDAVLAVITRVLVHGPGPEPGHRLGQQAAAGPADIGHRDVASGCPVPGRARRPAG